MSKLRKLARGKDCQIRLPGICNFNAETTVLAHYRLSGLCGTSLKPPDLLGAWSCSACHDVCDQRRLTHNSRETVRLAHCEGILRTLAKLHEMGEI